MKKVLLGLILPIATFVHAADNQITILNAVTVNLQGTADTPYKGEIKLLCISGYKWVMQRSGYGDSTSTLQQMYRPGPIAKTLQSPPQPVRCNE